MADFQRGGRRGLYDKYAGEEGLVVLQIGARNCVRHRVNDLIRLQQEHKLAFLTLAQIDFITGRYLTMIEDAAQEVCDAWHPTRLELMPGCQLTLLSTDFEMLAENVSNRVGLPVTVNNRCHLCDEERGHFGHHEEEDEE